MMERVALSAGRCGSECVEYSVRYAIYKKYKIIYEIMDDKVYILRVIHHSQNITTNFFLAENEIPYVVESD